MFVRKGKIKKLQFGYIEEKVLKNTGFYSKSGVKCNKVE